LYRIGATSLANVDTDDAPTGPAEDSGDTERVKGSIAAVANENARFMV
jgi:hypothetical protein